MLIPLDKSMCIKVGVNYARVWSDGVAQLEPAPIQLRAGMCQGGVRWCHWMLHASCARCSRRGGARLLFRHTLPLTHTRSCCSFLPPGPGPRVHGQDAAAQGHV